MSFIEQISNFASHNAAGMSMASGLLGSVMLGSGWATMLIQGAVLGMLAEGSRRLLSHLQRILYEGTSSPAYCSPLPSIMMMFDSVDSPDSSYLPDCIRGLQRSLLPLDPPVHGSKPIRPSTVEGIPAGYCGPTGIFKDCLVRPNVVMVLPTTCTSFAEAQRDLRRRRCSRQLVTHQR